MTFAWSASICQAGLFSEDWPEVTPEDRAQTASTVDTDAGAEILFYDHCYKEGDEALTISFFKRVKVFDERGVEFFKDFTQDSGERMVVKVLEVRVIRPDGTIVELDRKDVLARSATTFFGNTVTRRSIPIPGLVPGSIVDIRWLETLRWGYFGNGFLIPLADEHLPIKLSRLRILPRSDVFCYFSYHNMSEEMKQNKRGYWQAEARDVPPISNEPYTPSYFDIQPWVSFRYTRDKAELKPGSFWENRSWEIRREAKKKVEETDSDVVKKAGELTAGVTDPKEKLRKLYEFCTHSIVNLISEKAGLTPGELLDLKINDDPAKTLKTGRGTPYDINVLFASLAAASGFEVNFAECCDRSLMDWDPDCLDEILTPDFLIAVRNGEKWEFHDPGTPFVPFGMLSASNEGTAAVIGNSKAAEVLPTPTAPSANSQLLRAGDFTVDEEGKLTGKAVFKYSGHKARELKKSYSGQTPQERIDKFKEAIVELIPGANVSDVEILNADDPEKDAEVRFNLEVPGYAEVTGNRIFLAPSVFQKGSTPFFKKEKRTNDIRFPYAWEVHDNIRIAYPEDYVMEEGAAPHNVIDTPVLSYTVMLGASKTRSIVVYKRNLRISKKGFPVADYVGVKAIFDSMNTEDHHILTLRRKEAAAESAQNQ